MADTRAQRIAKAEKRVLRAVELWYGDTDTPWPSERKIYKAHAALAAARKARKGK